MTQVVGVMTAFLLCPSLQSAAGPDVEEEFKKILKRYTKRDVQ